MNTKKSKNKKGIKKGGTLKVTPLFMINKSLFFMSWLARNS